MFDSNFEIKFSQLADARLQEMVPSLSQYKVGFQLIEKNEDDTKGIGVMAFLVNNNWVYIPCFFLSGKLKLPCLYIKNYNMRVPLNDSWVSFIKSNELDTLGKLVPMDEVKADQSKADLLDIIGKRASEKNDLMEPEDIADMLMPKTCSETSLIEGLRDLGKDAFIKLADEMVENSDFANAVLRYYHPSELQKLAAWLDENDVPEGDIQLVQVLTKESAEARTLSDDEKKKMLREGSYIKDDRIDTSLVYKRDNKPDTGFSTPNQPGYYEVLMSDGTTKDAVIVFPRDFKYGDYPSNHGRRRISTRCAIIPADNTTKYFMVTASNVLCRNKKDVSDSKMKGDKTATGDNITKRSMAAMRSESILLVDKSGNAFVLDKNVEWPELYFTNKDSGKLHLRNGTLLIPNNVLVFKQFDSFEDTQDRQLALGDVNTYVRECADKAGMSSLKIYHDSSTGYYVNSDKADARALKKQAALELLVFRHGIHAREAEAMLKEASDHGARPLIPKTTRYLIKYASPVSELSTQMGTIGHVDADNRESQTIVSPAEMTDLAMKASDTGLKEVLDTSVLASLVGSAKSMSKVGEFLPKLIKALDSLGSIICLYYWDNEGFEEQYGRVEMVELEEKLKDVFSSLGDLTLFLKEKTIDADSLFDGNRGNISEDMGDS